MPQPSIKQRQLARMEQRLGQPTGIALLMTVVLLLARTCLPASFIASSPNRTAKSVTQQRAESSAAERAELKGRLQAQLDALLEDDATAMRNWKTFCITSGLNPTAALRNQPAEAMGIFLAEAGSYKQSFLLEFFDSVRRPLVGLDSINGEDPVTKSLLVRDLTVKHLEALIKDDPNMEKHWSDFRTQRLEELMSGDGDAARQARQTMALKTSFARPKKIQPGSMEALSVREAYFDGRNTPPEFDLDRGREDLR
eukprot:CAMPEP_0172708432 /NCGR_PEP_ID=MMETSP1074-20121228/50967_1 /TAXON_ID=2916 /ORGANISM="Ceratium fusus, Strain PA161109" /LENGTH=253 /DNA_ID=CAMNT_0013531401 /DNA_START=60 /DNA_END=821 /DNA_ORIENTATION=+